MYSCTCEWTWNINLVIGSGTCICSSKKKPCQKVASENQDHNNVAQFTFDEAEIRMAHNLGGDMNTAHSFHPMKSPTSIALKWWMKSPPVQAEYNYKMKPVTQAYRTVRRHIWGNVAANKH